MLDQWAEEIARNAVEFWFGNTEPLLEQLRRYDKLGIVRITEGDDGVIHLEGKVRTGIFAGVDPVNTLILIFFALFGEFWVYIPECKKALDLCKKYWKKKMKEKKRGIIKLEVEWRKGGGGEKDEDKRDSYSKEGTFAGGSS